MGFSTFFINRPIFASVLAILITLLGVISIPFLPVRHREGTRRVCARALGRESEVHRRVEVDGAHQSSLSFLWLSSCLPLRSPSVGQTRVCFVDSSVSLPHCPIAAIRNFSISPCFQTPPPLTKGGLRGISPIAHGIIEKLPKMKVTTRVSGPLFPQSTP